ncbi:DDE-type integrase/transposase/recombinase [Castellaniella ginsengisoli]|uniref:DDE-type integrase/transposase/recombinase n=1 Tax=Castellaniella ginsengisoli TaxID=546114 RepID=A0AB39CM99_9BURK
MLTNEQLNHLFDRLGVSPAGRELVRKVRNSLPARAVQSRGSNVNTRLASKKMDRMIHTESRHVEFPVAVEHEHDPLVLEYYPQPYTIPLEFIDADGEEHKADHTPDFLVIRDDAIIFEECKLDAKLGKLAQRTPYRFQRDEDGVWIAPQIEQQLAAQGFQYRLLTERSLPRHRVENLLHLADYFDFGVQPCDPEELARLNGLLAAEGALYLSELTSDPYLFSPDFLYKAVADGLAVADLDREPLTQPRRARLYRDAVLRDFMANERFSEDLPGAGRFVLHVEVGTTFSYEGDEYMISLAGEKELVCTNSAGKTIALERNWVVNAFAQGFLTSVYSPGMPALDLARYTEDDLATALRRQQILAAPVTDAPVSGRTIRGWRARAQAAASNGSHDGLALVPRISARGNRVPRIRAEQEALMDQVIEKYWKTPAAINFRACYRIAQTVFADAGEVIPSYPTFIARIKACETNRDIHTRYGKRMAYQKGEFASVLYYETPVHGSRPFQYVHVDHTELDIELIDGQTGKPLGRPWLTFAVDAYTRRILAMYLTFDPPSYHSVMMTVRDMVQRHGRLPEFFVVDNGRDLVSAAFEAFLQLMRVHLRMRPAGQPRAGAVMERVFGTANTTYIHNLAGNTKATKQVRMTTGKHLPVNFAEWTLESLYYGLSHWAFEYYDCEPHPALGCSPREKFDLGIKAAGSRPQRQILFTRDFLIATCPPADRGGLRVVDYQRGVKVHDHWYWNPQFQNPRNARKKIAVRYDPWDASTVFVWLADRWEPAVCRALTGLGQLTELERRALTEEYARRGGVTTDDQQSAQRLREFMKVFTPKGAMVAAQARQRENKSLYGALELASITPVPPAYASAVSAPDLKPGPDRSVKRPLPLADSPSTPNSLLQDLPKFDTF